MKIGAITLVRDSEKYIVPHLKMYKGVVKNVAFFLPPNMIGGSVGHGKPDNSESLIRQHCPEVQIEHATINRWGADLFNQALSLMSDCEKVVMFHADVVIAPEVWQQLLVLLEQDYDVYRLDMKKCTINYYHNFEYGVRDCMDNEPIAVKSHVRFSNFYDIPEDLTTYIIDNPTFEVHHFTGWKGVFLTQDWLEGRALSESRVSINDLKPPAGWLPCPDYIRKLFNENSI